MSETIDSRQLLAFTSLVQTKSFTETARIVGLTQSAISHSVKNLEADLGCQLVARTGRKIHITEDGYELYKEAQTILNQMQGVRARIQNRANWGKGRLRLGASTTACQHLLPTVLREFNECFPECILTIIPADTPELIDMARRHEIDLALVVSPDPFSDVSLVPLFKDELYLVASPIHSFAKAGSAKMNKIAHERLVLYNKKSRTFDLIDQFFRENKVSLTNHIELGSMEAIKELVKTNYGISFLASWTVENEVNRGSLVRVSFGRRQIQRQWGIAHAKDKKLSITEETFLGICQSVTKAMMN